MSVLLAGPFVGSFSEELLSFRPYITWVSKVLNKQIDSVVVSTHVNRMFMYQNAYTTCIPIEREWTFDELNQVGILYKALNRRDYLNYTGKIVTQVSEETKKSRENIKIHNLNYTQNYQPCSDFQKIYTSIPIPTDIKKSVTKDTILYIPSFEETEERAYKLYELLKINYNVIVIGDAKTHLQEKNLIMKRTDYLTNVYKCIIKWASECKMVVCPASHWTFLCKLQGVNVFSWGQNVAPYKFGTNSSLLPTCPETKIEKIYDQFLWYANKGD